MHTETSAPDQATDTPLDPLTGQDVSVTFFRDGVLQDSLDRVRSCTVDFIPGGPHATVTVVAHQSSAAWLDFVQATASGTTACGMALVLRWPNGDTKSIALEGLRKVSFTADGRKAMVEMTMVFIAERCNILKP